MMQPESIVLRSFPNESSPGFLGTSIALHLQPENPSKVWDHYTGFYILAGEGSYEDWRGNVHPLRPGDFGQHLPGKWHKIKRNNPKEWIEYSVRLSLDLYNAFVTTQTIDPEKGVFHSAPNPIREEEFLSIHNSLIIQSNTMLATALNRIANYLLKIKFIGSEKIGGDENQLEKMKAILSRPSNEKELIRHLAENFPYSYSTLRTKFKSYTGLTPARYRIEKKIEQAVYLIKEGELNFKEISSLLGYTDPFTFSRQFKEVTKISPREFRKRVFLL